MSWNRALWRKTATETVILLVPCFFIVVGFCWLFVYLSSQMAISKLPSFLKTFIPAHLLQLNSMKLDDWGTRRGVLSMIFIHPVVEMTCIIWAIVRGSAAVSGEISRGTMEMLLAQPISRWSLITVNAVTGIVGCIVLAAGTIVGIDLGLRTVSFRDEDPALKQVVSEKNPILNLLDSVSTGLRSPLAIIEQKPATEPPIRSAFFIPGAINLCCYTICLLAVATLFSAFDHYRARTIGLLGLWGISQIVLDVTVRWVPESSPLKWLSYLTIKTGFEPQRIMFSEPAMSYQLQQQYCLMFLSIAGLAYLAAIVVFARRDLPTPL